MEVEQLEGDNKYHAEHYGLQVKPEHVFLLFCCQANLQYVRYFLLIV